MDEKDYLIAVLKTQRNQALDALAQTIAVFEKERADREKESKISIDSSAMKNK